MNIDVINFSPGPMVAKPKDWEKIENMTALSMEVIARLRYIPGKDVLGYQFDISLIFEDELIVKTGVLFGLKLLDVDKYLNNSLSREHNVSSIAEITEFIWPFVVGAFAARCADNGIQMILPRVNFYKFAEEVMLIKSDSSE